MIASPFLYPITVAVGIVVLLAIELVWWRTGLLRRPAYWISIAIVWAFQVPVDGWLTKLSAPIVVYQRANLGIRWPWDIPIEDFGFGWVMVTMAMMLWVRAARRTTAGAERAATPVEHR